jgi:hypothetical protein
VPIRDFRFANYKTEKDRIEATVRANQEFCDSVPSPQKQRYERSLRPRVENKEIGPQFRFTAKSGVERVYDQLSKRITSEFREKDMIDRSLKSTIRNHRKLNQTTSPKQLLPSIHNKTHFKAATSVFLKSQLEKSLKDKTNYLSRALRDVSPTFASFSVDTAVNSKTPQNERESSKQSQSIIKRDPKNDKKLQSVHFAGGAVCTEESEAKRASKIADQTAANNGKGRVVMSF